MALLGYATHCAAEESSVEWPHDQPQYILLHFIEAHSRRQA